MTNNLTKQLASLRDFDQLFDRIGRFAIGFEPMFQDFKASNISTSYPPLNIIRKSDKEVVLELAVAGFKKGEIEIEEHDGTLTVRGDKKDENKVDEGTYHYHGIAARSFVRHFRLAEHYEIEDASLEDGILSIKLIQEVPEALKPKLIPIK